MPNAAQRFLKHQPGDHDQEDHGNWADGEAVSAYDATTPEEIASVIRTSEPVKFAGKEVPGLFTRREGGELTVVEYNGDAYLTAESADRWIWSSTADRLVEDLATEIAEQARQDFMASPGTVYHATDSSNTDSILGGGLGARAESRGLTNRGVGAAVFTTVDRDKAEGGVYGDTVFAIDLDAMKRDGVSFDIESEPAVHEIEARSALAHAIGYENFEHDGSGDGADDPDTVIVRVGNIPPKYLQVLKADPASRFRKHLDGEHDQKDHGNWATGAGRELNLEITDAYSGQMNGVVYARENGKLVGRISYVDFNGTLSINMIEVAPDYRRKGVATALVEKLKAEYPGRFIQPGYTTEDGTPFATALYDRGVLQSPADYFFSAMERVPRDEGVQEAEEQWRGGVADLGNREAAYLIQAMPGYFDYRSEVESEARRAFGNDFKVYRLMSREQREAWQNGEDIGPVATSLSPKIAEGFLNFAGLPVGDYELVEFFAEPSTIVMAGKPEEQELVIDSSQIRGDSLKTLKQLTKVKKHLPGEHDQQDHGNWAQGMDSPTERSRVSAPDTPEFRFWFGESKVVDSEGKPLPLYHATDKNFTVFNVNAGDNLIDRMVGPHFAVDPLISSSFAFKPFEGGVQHGTAILPVFVRMEKPRVIVQEQFPGGLQSDQYAIAEDVAEVVFRARPDLFEKWYVGLGNRLLPSPEAGAPSLEERAKAIYADLSSGRDPSRVTVYGYGDGATNYFTFSEGKKYEANRPFGRLAQDFGFATQPSSDREFAREIVDEYRRLLSEQGYDGIVYRNTSPTETRTKVVPYRNALFGDTGFQQESLPEGTTRTQTFIPFTPEQIKSVFNSKPTEDPDITKFDPDQPRAPKGAENGGQWVASGRGGTAFVSPNIDEDLDWDAVDRNLSGQRHETSARMVADVYAFVGLKGFAYNGVGAWSDGQENTLVGSVQDSNFEDLKAAVAMQGLLLDQKAAIAFQTDPDGPAKLYEFLIPDKSLREVNAGLKERGVLFHTMVPTNGGVKVLVFSPDGSGDDDVNSAAQALGATSGKSWRGQGAFVGDASDSPQRPRARLQYENEINRWFDLRGHDRKREWERLRLDWSERFGRILKRIVEAFAKFDPNQPRAAAGTPEGGQWVAGPAGGATGGGLRDDGGVRGGAGRMAASRGAGPADAPLAGLPSPVDIKGYGPTHVGPYLPARRAAEEYMREAGITTPEPRTYAKLDKERAKRIADEFERLEHNPNDPEVKAAYAALIEETIAQWKVIEKTGLKVEFIDFAKTGDPYAANPRLATEDVVRNNHLWVFPTLSGFGSDASVDVSDNPLLADTGIVIGGHRLVANDVFRIVHDYFGHIKEGIGFRAEGEENAWRQHSAMYSPRARRAMTTETRGQNSWLNFGPHGEKNRTASAGDTHYADQKVGLLPLWVSEDGAFEKAVDRFRKHLAGEHDQSDHGNWATGSGTDTPEFRDWFRDSTAVDDEGRPRVFYHGSNRNFSAFAAEREGTNSNVFGSWKVERSGIFFASTPEFAGEYVNPIEDGGNITPVYLRVESPLDLRNGFSEAQLNTLEELGLNPRYYSRLPNHMIWEAFDHENGGREFVAALRSMGYDGVRLTDVSTGQDTDTDTLVVFDPEQIKSAIGNRGTFDPREADITKHQPGEHDQKDHGNWARGAVGRELSDEDRKRLDFKSFPIGMRFETKKEPGVEWRLKGFKGRYGNEVVAERVDGKGVPFSMSYSDLPGFMTKVTHYPDVPDAPPKFGSQKEFNEWSRRVADEFYGGMTKMTTTPLYARAYREAKPLMEAEKKAFKQREREKGRANAKALEEAGLADGDEVVAYFPGPFLSTVKHSGRIEMRSGAPHVRLTSEAAVAGKGGRLKYTTLLPWTPSFKKPGEVEKAVDRFRKHLDGEHDQADHGNWADGGSSLSRSTERTPTELRALLDKTAESLGYDPKQVKMITSGAGPAVTVGGRRYQAAGLYYEPPDPTKPGVSVTNPDLFPSRIEIFNDAVRFVPDEAVAGLLAHEVMHYRFGEVLHELRGEAGQFEAEMANDWSLVDYWKTKSGFIRPERRSEFDERFPVMAALPEMSPHTLERDSKAYYTLKSLGGVSEYSSSYWQEAEKPTVSNGYKTAVNETLAEIARLVDPTKERTNLRGVVPEPWLSMYSRVNTQFDRLKAAGRVRKSEPVVVRSVFLSADFAIVQPDDAVLVKLFFEDGSVGFAVPEAVAKFDPDQPRAPAGEPNGGQWVSTTESAAFKNWFGDSKVVDPDEGKPKVVYHGTLKDFSTFDRTRGNVEANFGAGFYFSDASYDVETNYSTIVGPDQRTKIEMFKERMNIEDEDEATDLFGMSSHDYAMKELTDHGGATMPVYLSIQNPFIVTAGDHSAGDSFLSVEREWSEDGEDLLSEEGPALDFIENIRRIAADYSDTNPDGIAAELYEALAEHDGLPARVIDKVVRGSEALAYASDAEGRLVMPEIYRRALEETGFDGVIDKYVGNRFPGMKGMDGATHYTVFRPEQIKSAIGNSGAFDPKDKDITKFDPEQPRVPAGNEDGGQWTKLGGITRELAAEREEKYQTKAGEPRTRVVREFRYRDPEGREITNPKALERIKALGIPPGVDQVRINPDPAGRLQAVWVDAKGRTASMYSKEHTRDAAMEKFARLREFTEAYPKIREGIKARMESGDDAERRAAEVLYTISLTGFRIGGTGDTGAEEQAYGAATLLNKHVKVVDDETVRFTFTGKHGVEQTKTVKDATLARIVRERKTSQWGQPLFGVSPSKVRSVFKEIAGPDFLVKDMRTHLGTATALREIGKRKGPAPNEKTFAKWQREVATKVSDVLGNTPTIAMGSYIDFHVWDKWRKPEWGPWVPKKLAKSDSDDDVMQDFVETVFVDGEFPDWRGKPVVDPDDGSDAVSRFAKHLQGEHDQSDHGNWADNVKPGMRFEHSSWLDEDKKPLVHEVTRVLSSGLVYYRPVYISNGVETFGKPVKVGTEELPKYVKRWLDPAKAETADAMRVTSLMTDNPGGEWLEAERAHAATRPRNSAAGSLTAKVQVENFPVDELLKLPGARDEHLKIDFDTSPKTAPILASLRAGEPIREPIFVRVNYLGEAQIAEGNHRTRAAAKVGMKGVPVEIAFFAGGERQPGPFNIERFRAAKVKKHLPGEHDQESHGNWADGSAEVGKVVEGVTQYLMDTAFDLTLDKGIRSFSIGEDKAKEIVEPLVRSYFKDRNPGEWDDEYEIASSILRPAATEILKIGLRGQKYSGISAVGVLARFKALETLPPFTKQIRELAKARKLAKHLDGQHDQADHGNWADGSRVEETDLTRWYHGTDPKNVESLLAAGFDIARARKQAFGGGVYATNRFAMARNYAGGKLDGVLEVSFTGKVLKLSADEFFAMERSEEFKAFAGDRWVRLPSDTDSEYAKALTGFIKSKGYEAVMIEGLGDPDDLVHSTLVVFDPKKLRIDGVTKADDTEKWYIAVKANKVPAAVRRFAKHLEGEHDQADHGNWARHHMGDVDKYFADHAANKAMKDFFAEVESRTWRNPFDERARGVSVVGSGTPENPDAIGQVELWVDKTTKEPAVYIAALSATPTRKGAGAAAMKLVTDAADKYGLPLRLSPKAFGTAEGRMSTPQLRKWYKALGFDPNKDWVRLPKVAKYDPDQPRAPEGSEIGGQWIAGGATTGAARPKQADMFGPPDLKGVRTRIVTEGRATLAHLRSKLSGYDERSREAFKTKRGQIQELLADFNNQTRPLAEMLAASIIMAAQNGDLTSALPERYEGPAEGLEEHYAQLGDVAQLMSHMMGTFEYSAITAILDQALAADAEVAQDAIRGMVMNQMPRILGETGLNGVSLAEYYRRGLAYADSELDELERGGSSAVDNYIGSYYAHMNGYLRETVPDIEPEPDYVSEYINNALDDRVEAALDSVDFDKAIDEQVREDFGDEIARLETDLSEERITQEAFDIRVQDIRSEVEGVVRDVKAQELRDEIVEELRNEAQENWADHVRSLIDEYGPEADKMVTLIDRVPPTATDMMLIRSVRSGNSLGLRDLKPGDDIDLKGFTSLGTRNVSSFGSTKLVVHVPEGSLDVLPTSNDSEAEVIFNHNTSLRVLAVVRDVSEPVIVAAYAPEGNGDGLEEDDA